MYIARLSILYSTFIPCFYVCTCVEVIVTRYVAMIYL